MDQVEAMYFIAKCWLEVKPQTINNCWKHTKLLEYKEKGVTGDETTVVEYPTSSLPLDDGLVIELNSILPDLPGITEDVTDIHQLDLETDEDTMVLHSIVENLNHGDNDNDEDEDAEEEVV